MPGTQTYISEAGMPVKVRLPAQPSEIDALFRFTVNGRTAQPGLPSDGISALPADTCKAAS